MRALFISFLSAVCLLLSGCATDSNEQFSEGYRSGNYAQMNQAANRGANVDSVDKGRHSLVVAIKNNDLKMVQYLLSKGANPDYATVSGMYPIHHAVYANNTDITKALVNAGADVNAIDDQNNKPLFYAAMKSSDVEIINILLSAGSKLNLDPQGGEFLLNGLSESVRKKNYKQVAAMIAADVEMNFIFSLKQHWTLILNSVLSKDNEMTQLLLSGNPDVNIAGFDGTTPLYVAVVMNDAGLVSQLVSAGADCNQKSLHNITAYQYAKRKNLDSLLPLMGKCHIVD